MWPELRERLVKEVSTIRMGDVADFTNYMGAVIDEKAWKGHKEAIDTASGERRRGRCRRRDRRFPRLFIEPTVLETKDPASRLGCATSLWPIVTTYVYPEKKWDETLELVDDNPHALTGAVFSEDRAAIDQAGERLRYTAGNFYVNAASPWAPWSGSSRSAARADRGRTTRRARCGT